MILFLFTLNMVWWCAKQPKLKSLENKWTLTQPADIKCGPIHENTESYVKLQYWFILKHSIKLYYFGTYVFCSLYMCSVFTDAVWPDIRTYKLWRPNDWYMQNNILPSSFNIYLSTAFRYRKWHSIILNGRYHRVDLGLGGIILKYF